MDELTSILELRKLKTVDRNCRVLEQTIQEISEPIIEKKAGRSRKNDEDKATPYPIRLHAHHQQMADLLLGEGKSEKIRYALEEISILKERERRQINFLSKRIESTYRAFRRTTNPEISEPVKKKKAIELFKQEIEQLEATLDFYFFSITDLKRVIRKEDISKVDLIMVGKEMIQ